MLTAKSGGTHTQVGKLVFSVCPQLPEPRDHTVFDSCLVSHYPVAVMGAAGTAVLIVALTPSYKAGVLVYCVSSTLQGEPQHD